MIVRTGLPPAVASSSTFSNVPTANVLPSGLNANAVTRSSTCPAQIASGAGGPSGSSGGAISFVTSAPSGSPGIWATAGSTLTVAKTAAASRVAAEA